MATQRSNSWSRIQDDGLFYKKKTYQPRQLGTMRKTRQPYLQASGGGRPTKVLSTHQFESRGSSDRQSAKVDIARTMLSMAGVSRPGTAQSAQPTAIQRSPFSPYQVGLARPVPSSLHRESCEPRVHDSHARVYFPRAFATGRGRSINESELFSCSHRPPHSPPGNLWRAFALR